MGRAMLPASACQPRTTTPPAPNPSCAPQVSVPKPGQQPDLVRVDYSFKFGIRRFSMHDDLLIKRGRIVRLKRNRR